MLERNEMYIARTLFKNKVLASDGQSFESFFTSVMIKSNIILNKLNLMVILAIERTTDLIKQSVSIFKFMPPKISIKAPQLVMLLRNSKMIFKAFMTTGMICALLKSLILL